MPPRPHLACPRPGSRRAVVIGAGSFGTAVAVLLARGGFRTTLQARTAEQAAQLEADRENKAYLPGIEFPRELRIEPASRGPRPRGLRLPRRALARARRGDRRPGGAGLAARTPVVSLAKGLVPPDGIAPTVLLSPTRSAPPAWRASAAPPTRARWSPRAPGSSPPRSTSGSRSRSPTSSSAPAWSASARATRSASSSPAPPRTPPRSPRARPSRRGSTPPAPPPATSSTRSGATPSAQGARPESMIGLAGTGDLVGTALAPQSRNRRAGELLAEGVPAAEIPERIGQAVEALDLVPLLARALERAGVEAPVTDALAGADRGRAAARRVGRAGPHHGARRPRASAPAAPGGGAWERVRAWWRRRRGRACNVARLAGETLLRASAAGWCRPSGRPARARPRVCRAAGTTGRRPAPGSSGTVSPLGRCMMKLTGLVSSTSGMSYSAQPPSTRVARPRAGPTRPGPAPPGRPRRPTCAGPSPVVVAGRPEVVQRRHRRRRPGGGPSGPRS